MKVDEMLTARQYEFLFMLVNNFLPLLKNNKPLKNESRKIFRSNSQNGLFPQKGAIAAVKNVCGVCDFDEETVAPFANIVFSHLKNTTNVRTSYTKEERNRILDQYGLRCAKCGKTVYDMQIDHILPFFLVGEEFGMSNLQCLCPDCNSSKGTNIEYHFTNEQVRVY